MRFLSGQDWRLLYTRPVPAESTDLEDILFGGSCPAMLKFLQHSLQTAREKHVHQGHGYRIREAMHFLKPRWSLWVGPDLSVEVEVFGRALTD